MLDKEILLEFCNDKQADVVNAYFDHDMCYARAAKSLDIDPSNMRKAIKRTEARAAKKGHIPSHPKMEVGAGRELGKVTTQVNAMGEVERVWYRHNKELQTIADAIKEICEQARGLAPKVKKPRFTNKDVLSVYNIGDAHIAMQAWEDVSGVNFDIDIASRDLVNAMSDLIARSSQSETCLLLNLGDAIHFHDDSHTTKANGHSLDGDSRIHKAFMITCNLMNMFVEMALQKHKKVIVRNVIGNHDEEMAMALKFQMEAYWRNEKRVTIEMSPSDVWFYQFGGVMLMATHGHQMKPEKMIPYMSAREPKMWGETTCRRALHGHFHSKSVVECLGGRVEGFSNLAPNDAWHAAKGYLSELECVLVEYHRCGKEIGRQNFVLLPKEVGDSDNAGMHGRIK